MKNSLSTTYGCQLIPTPYYRGLCRQCCNFDEDLKLCQVMLCKVQDVKMCGFCNQDVKFEFKEEKKDERK